MDSKYLIISLIIIYGDFSITDAKYKQVCYYTNWSQYRLGDAKFLPENIDPHLCTHINYAFAQLSPDGTSLRTYEWNDEKLYERVHNLKRSNKDLKVLISVGGWNQGVQTLSQMLQSSSKIQTFAKNAIQFARKYSFDGLDLDFEYPALRGSPSGDKQKFTVLLKQLRNEIETEKRYGKTEKLLLTLAVGAGRSTVDAAYEVSAIATFVDFINIMTYDFHGTGGDSVTDHNSPLYAKGTASMEWASNYWAKKGAPKEKLIIGLAAYGRGFTLQNSKQNAVGAPVIGRSNAGDYTKESGYISYFETCSINGVRKYDSFSKNPFLVNGDQWYSYEDKRSIQTKVEWIKSNGFGGAMIWAMDLDDFSGKFCKNGQYPLLNRIKKTLFGSDIIDYIPPTTTLKPLSNTIVTENVFPTDISTVGKPTDSNCKKFLHNVHQSNTYMWATMKIPVTSTISTYNIKIVFSNEITKALFWSNQVETLSSKEIIVKPHNWFSGVKAGGILALGFQLQAQDISRIHFVSIEINGNDICEDRKYADLELITDDEEEVISLGDDEEEVISLGDDEEEVISLENFCSNKSDGVYSIPGDCSHFNHCSHNITHYKDCPSGLYFNPLFGVCDWPRNVPNCERVL